MNSSSSIFRKIALNEFESQFGELIANRAIFFAYFHGGYNDQGVSWCSDCDVARPIVEESVKILENQNKVLFVKFAIENKLDWANKEFVYRVHPKVRLQRVPTLIYYQDGVEFGRLTEGELFDKENVQEFVKQALE